ncbi:molybdopterin molybdotransferase MoeA [Jiulongibacter sp. NS-SX5]|uniref:molybdopterin molybdotransferase MoeA n=1 Tax=Jiulongibacter sp. NS-SX5 TaxID=3463854 RepID=UPI0040599CC4
MTFMPLTPVKTATELILKETRNYGIETISFEYAVGRVLAEEITADRDFPPFDRVTMDGFAFNSKAYVNGIRSFTIKAIQYAGEAALSITHDEEAIEVMTGTPLPKGCDSVIRVEDTSSENGTLLLPDGLPMCKNIHYQGLDRKKGEVILPIGHPLKSSDLAILATVGKPNILVRKRPSVAIITSGDELVDVTQTPEAHQIRKSNVFAISAVMEQLVDKAEHFHLPDDLDKTTSSISKLLEDYNFLILSGGVSAGKKDYIPQAMESLGVEKVFHKIAQRPGKPMWFGQKGETLVFALPGNPVSAFMCAVRYVKPWLEACLQVSSKEEFAILSEDVEFKPQLNYFLQVKINNENGQLIATPEEGHGSGDLANLSLADAFLELPLKEGHRYSKGKVFRVWRY